MNGIDIKEIASEALSQVESILNVYLPGGKQSGREYKCADLSGGNGDSCCVNSSTGKWADFATGEKGGDLVSLVAAIKGCSQLDAARELAAFIGHTTGSTEPHKPSHKPVWSPIVPVPADAPAPPVRHYKHGEPAHIYEFHNQASQLMQVIHRYELSEDEKQFSPLTFCQNESGKTEWRFQGLTEFRPLYGLDRLTDSEKYALIVEGEKACEAARRIVGNRIKVLTWSGGSNAVFKTDWSPLAGYSLCVWPDADKAGIKAAINVVEAAMEAGAASGKIVIPPDDSVKGFDLADAEEDGWTEDRVMALLKASVSPEEFREMFSESTAPAPKLFEKASEFFNTAIKIDYLIHKVFEANSLISITGPSGQFKSFIAVCIGCAVATGKEWNGQATRKGAVLYLAGEGRNGIKRRVAAWCKVNGIDMAQLDFYLSKQTLMMDGSNIGSIASEMAGIDVALVIIDTTARHIDGHENDTKDMCRYIAAVDALKDRLDATGAMIHHTGHDASRGRGNTSYKAALDAEVMCDKGVLRFTKAKDSEPHTDIEFKLEPVELGIDEESGEPITSCVVKYGDRSERTKKASMSPLEQTSHTALIKTCIKEKVQTGVSYYASLSGWRQKFYELRRMEDETLKTKTLEQAFTRTKDALKKMEAVGFTENGAVPLTLKDQETIRYAIGDRRHYGDIMATLSPDIVATPHPLSIDRDDVAMSPDVFEEEIITFDADEFEGVLHAG